MSSRYCFNEETTLYNILGPWLITKGGRIKNFRRCCTYVTHLCESPRWASLQEGHRSYKGHKARLGGRQMQKTNTAQSSWGTAQMRVFMNLEMTATWHPSTGPVTDLETWGLAIYIRERHWDLAKSYACLGGHSRLPFSSWWLVPTEKPLLLI